VEEVPMIVRWGLAAITFGAMALAAESPTVTFHKDVLPILQKNCQSCHRPGQIAPMPLLSYAEARPWAKAMKTAALFPFFSLVVDQSVDPKKVVRGRRADGA
jgi:hypothetical protein